MGDVRNFITSFSRDLEMERIPMEVLRRLLSNLHTLLFDMECDTLPEGRYRQLWPFAVTQISQAVCGRAQDNNALPTLLYL